MLAGKQIKTAKAIEYLGMNITYNEFKAQGSLEGQEIAMKTTEMMELTEMPDGKVNRATVVMACQMMVLLVVTFGLHLIPAKEELIKNGRTLKKKI